MNSGPNSILTFGHSACNLQGTVFLFWPTNIKWITGGQKKSLRKQEWRIKLPSGKTPLVLKKNLLHFLGSLMMNQAKPRTKSKPRGVLVVPLPDAAWPSSKRLAKVHKPKWLLRTALCWLRLEGVIFGTWILQSGLKFGPRNLPTKNRPFWGWNLTPLHGLGKELGAFGQLCLYPIRSFLQTCPVHGLSTGPSGHRSFQSRKPWKLERPGNNKFPKFPHSKLTKNNNM